MTNLTPTDRYVNPSSVDGYFDKIQAWLQVTAAKPELAKLETHCGKGGIYAENRAARWDSKFLQRVELRQPQQEALEWLALRKDAFINRIEIALDLIFANFAHREDTWDFLQRRLLRRWHGRDQSVRFFGDDNLTPYDGPRTAPNILTCYCEPYSRNTGELHVIHLEWRANRARAVRSAGIVEPGDIIGFSFRQFWRRRLLLVHVPDKEKLGRLVRNSRHKTRDRKSRINRHGHDHDCRYGHVLVEGRATIQELADYVRPARIARLLQVIDNRPFLPPEETHSFCNYPAASFTTPQPP